MILVGIDVAKDKHDCCITNTDGEMLFDIFTITNNSESFDILYERIRSVAPDLSKVKVGLEATGHYNYNILSYLLDKHLTAYVINPLHTNVQGRNLPFQGLLQSSFPNYHSLFLASIYPQSIPCWRNYRVLRTWHLFISPG